MNAQTFFGAIALAAGALASQSAAAGCTDTFNLTSMGPPAATVIGNNFQGAQQFNDCYNFTLSSSAEAFGLTLEWDLSNTSGIDLDQVSLSGGSLSSTVVDDTPSLFSFSNLLAGTYQLIVSGDVTSQWRESVGSVGYFGLLATTRSSIAAPVPEPETYAMLALGLVIVGWSAKRRNA